MHITLPITITYAGPPYVCMVHAPTIYLSTYLVIAYRVPAKAKAKAEAKPTLML